MAVFTSYAQNATGSLGNRAVTVTSTATLATPWDAPSQVGSSAIAGGSVQYRQGGDAWADVTDSGIATSATISDLTTSTTYGVRGVATNNSAGSGAYVAGSGTIEAVQNCPATANTLAADWCALIDLYKSTNGDSWTNNTNWSTSTTAIPSAAALNNWHGVTISGGACISSGTGA